MESKKHHIDLILQRPGKFLWRVLVGFKRNQGLLLAGAVAYYTLLSVIPMLALILVGLSHFIEGEQLYNTIHSNLKLVIPAYAESVSDQVWGFLARRQLVGIIGILFMLFFSSMAFTVLESAMAVIFSHRSRKHRRHFLISAIIPYAYIFLLGIGVLVITIVAGALGALSDKHLILLGRDLSLAGGCMVVAAACEGATAYLIKYAVDEIFIARNEWWLRMIPLAVMAAAISDTVLVW